MRLTTIIASAVLALGLLAGCGGEDKPQAEPTPSATSATPSPTTREEKAEAAAVAAINRYLEVDDEVYSGAAEPKAYETVTRGTATGDSKNWAILARQKKRVAEGPYKVLWAKRVVTDLDQDIPTLEIETCVDVSKTKITEAGKPFTGVKADRLNTTYGVSDYDGDWYVSYIKTNGPNKC